MLKAEESNNFRWDILLLAFKREDKYEQNIRKHSDKDTYSLNPCEFYMITENLIFLISQLLNDFSSHSEENIKFLLNSIPITKYTFLKTSVRKGITSFSEVVKVLFSTLELPEIIIVLLLNFISNHSIVTICYHIYNITWNCANIYKNKSVKRLLII
jgi:hypothetical protein